MNTRSTIIEAAAELLGRSTTGDISTRAVCSAAGVQQPVLYRLFGDKDGLLAATVDHVWEQYLGMKRGAERSPDPLQDLRSGWDSHTSFALAHPSAYRLLFASGAAVEAVSAGEAMRLLREVIDRLAAQGRLRIDPGTAAQMVMAANTGIALALVLRPGLYPDVSVSKLVRDAIHHAILNDAAPAGGTDPARIAAITLRRSLQAPESNDFTPGEAGLLDEWLERLHTRRTVT